MKPQHLLYEKMLRRCVREDPSECAEGVCYEYEKVLCGGSRSFVVLLDGFIIEPEL